MLELLAGAGLAISAGLNAYIPLIILGLADKFTDFIVLPVGWSWLTHDWVLIVLGVLLLIEIIADKIPSIDTLNDWVHTVVRPSAGGIAFGAGSSSETLNASLDNISPQQWLPLLFGFLLALAIHCAKMFARPILNTLSAGIAAPIVSVLEDAGSLFLSILSVIAPLLVIVAVCTFVIMLWRIIQRYQRGRPVEP